MANVSFHIGTTTPPNTGLTPAGLYVDSANGQIFYSNLATSKKQIGSTMKMMQDKRWIQLSGTQGKLLGNLTATEKEVIANYASEIYVSYYRVPFGSLCPNLNNNDGANVDVSYSALLHRSPGGTNYFTTHPNPHTIVYSTVNPQLLGGNVAWLNCSIDLDTWQESHTYYYFNKDGNRTGNTRSNELGLYFYIIAYRF